MKTVSFGKRTRLKFWSGGTLEQWHGFQGPAIYALTYKQNAAERPKSHTVVYFGESNDLANPSIHTELQKWWQEHSQVEDELHLFFHPMPGSTQYERAQVQHQLALEYEPKGND